MASDSVSESNARSIRARQTFRLVVVVVLVAIVVAFAVDNSQDVEVGWLFGEGSLPLCVVIVATFVVGGLAGYVAGRRHG
jgi:uncharacterized integral membrane protein